MTVINTNTAAINAQYNLSKVQSAMDDAMSALSSGKRINSAADDAAGLSIITRMESQVRGLNQAMKNAADGQNMIATAEGAMDEMTNMLQRMRELAIQASNDTMSDTDRKNLNAEVDQLVAEIDRVVDTTTYNDIKLLDGSFSGSFQIGAKSGESMGISVGNLSSTALGTSMVGVASNAMISNEATGTEAVTTISQLAFNGNDSYTFTLKLGDKDGNEVSLGSLTGAMVGGDAEAVATAIRTAINTNVNGAAPDFNAGDIDVQANGNTVTIKNNVGGKIDISSFSATGAGTAAYTSISGAGDSKTLGGIGVDDAVTNAGGGGATAANEALVLDKNKDYTFRINDQYIEVNNFDGTDGTSRDDLLGKLKLAVGDNENVSITTNGAGSVTFALANTDGADIEITNFNALSEAAGHKGSMTLTTRVDENNSQIGDNTFVSGGSDWSYIDGDDVVQLTFSDNTANYSFNIETTSYTVDRASQENMSDALIALRDEINTDAANSAHALYQKVEARVVDGKLELENLQNSASGARGTMMSTYVAADSTADVTGADLNEINTPDTADKNFNDDLDYQLIQEGDSVTLTFSQTDADYSFRLSSALGSDAVGGTIDVNIQTVSKNQTLAAALQEAADQINENANLTATVSGNELDIKYVNTEGLPAIKNIQGQDLAASTKVGSDSGTSPDTDELTMWFTERAADYSFTVSDGTDTETVTITTSGGESLGEQLEAAQTQLATAFTTDVTFVAGGDTLRVKSGGTGADYTITALNSKNEAVKLENFLSTGNQHANKLEIGSFTSTEKQAVAAGAATIGGNNLVTAGNYTVNGTEASTTETFIQVSGDDSYEFTLTGAGGGQLIRADVAGGSLSAIANAINAHSGTEKITASVDGNTLKLTREDGGSIAMTGFSSDGSGTFNVTHAAGQGSAEVLNDDAAAVGATTAAAGLASASTMSLEMSGTDTVTFNISDGDTIAKVRAVSFDTTNNAAALAEIQSALSAAGSSITASIGGAGAATDPIVLTNSSGGQIKLTEFTSDSTETMTATPGAGQGVGKILDDTGLSGSGSALSSVNLASQEGADDALAIIDAAMENINSTRSELGAMSNRLDHTINNLGNVVVNTEASQSRIEDADFATETSNLTKAQILSQAATAMLAQANASKQSVLSLLQG